MKTRIKKALHSLTLHSLAICTLIPSASAAPRIYNGSANGNDVPVAAVTDSRGNLYVTGYSANAQADWQNPNPTTDIVTVKYSPDGVQLWAMRYDGPFRRRDFPSAITVDAADNVYVTGSTEHDPGEYDFVTIRYNAANVVTYPWGGQFVTEPQTNHWAVTWDGLKSNDRAVGLVVDSDERLFVTGTKIAPQGQHYIVTLGYDRETGSRLSFPTTYSYGDACAIAADRNGHIYVAGQDQDSGDVVTLQYDAGDFVANAHPAPNWNVPGDIGQSVAPVAMKTFGTSIYVTGAATDNNHNGSFALFKYNDQGAEQWVQLDGAGEGLDHPTDMAIDSAGNIYVTGYAQGGINPQTNQTENDYLTLKYTPAGALARFWMYGSNGDRSDVSTAIGIDGHNRVFVTGYSQNVNSDAYDAFTGRLDPLGGFTWTRRFIGTANRTCAARRIAVSNDNSVYVVGTQISAEQQADFQISKYRWDGAVLW